MEFLLIFSGAFLIAFSGALIPGPMLSLTAARSLREGFIAGPMITAGHAAAELILIVLILLGFGRVLASDEAAKWIYTIGGLLLIISSVSMLKYRLHSPGLYVANDKKSGSFIGGILISVSNPTWSIWWASIGIVYLTRSLRLGIIGVAVFFTGHILADLLWYSFVSYMVSRGKNRINPLVYKRILCVCAAFMGGFGVWFLLSGIRSF